MSEPVYLDNRVIGKLEGDAFVQRITRRHIYKRYAAKGMDLSIYWMLKGTCRYWKLVFTDSGEELTIPFHQIATVGFEVSTGVGKQLMVKLKDFGGIKPLEQARMM